MTGPLSQLKLKRGSVPSVIIQKGTEDYFPYWE